jgi:hypothetical protein
MSPKIKWSAFIYTRTYSVDYRTLVVPDDFSEEKEEWVRAHIRDIHGALAQQSINLHQELPQRLFLSDDQHYIFGVLCNLRKILSEDDRNLLAEKYLTHAPEKAKDITVDKQPRLIPFAFLGYVIPKTPDIQKLPPIRFDLEIFKPLCEYICHKWMEMTQDPPIFLPYNIEESPEWLFEPSPKLDNLPTLNTNPRKLALHPGAESYTQQLWTAAALCDKPQTLWIGQIRGNPNPESILVSSYPEKITLTDSRFLNIALPNIHSLEIYSEQPGSIERTPDVNIVICGLREIEDRFNKTLGEIENSVNVIRGEIEKSVNVIRGKIEKLKNTCTRRLPTEQESKRFQEIIKKLENKIGKIKCENRKNEEEIAKLESELSKLKGMLKNTEEIRNQE